MSNNYKKERTAVDKAIRDFNEKLKPIYELCQNNDYLTLHCYPFATAAEEFSSNFGSQDHYAAVFKAFTVFGTGSAVILNKIMSVFNVEQQEAVYDSRRSIFIIIDAAVNIMRTVLALGYASSTEIARKNFGGDIGDTCVGNGMTPNQCMRKVRIKADNIYVSEGKYNVTRDRLTTRRCRLSPYAETGYLEELKDWCAQGTNSVLSNFCSLTSEFIRAKEMVMSRQNDRVLQGKEITGLLSVWNVFREQLLRTVLQNYIILNNSSKVSCLEKFIEEQHDLMLALIRKRHQIETAAEETILEDLTV